jgi:peptidyl-prolyl cis-trans isomerase D
MLQRIRDGLGRWVFGLVLGLIAISFVFWGVDFNLTGPTFAAKVNGEEVSLAEFDRDLQIEQSQFQELYRVELDEDLRRQLRRSVVDRLVQRKALLQRVHDSGYRASDQRLAEYIRSAAAFQVGGEFSMDIYTTQLALQGLSPRAFEEMQREQLALLDLQIGIADSTFLTPAEYSRFVELANQQREIAYALFEIDALLEQVDVEDEAIAAHYEQNGDLYMTEEAAAIDYVELRRADVAGAIEVTEQELEDYYARRRDMFRTDEERRARHILITPASGESAEETEARAADVVERVRGGEEFDALAAELSDDPGTAQQGGDLGWIAPGMLAGPFEDALFAMQAGEVRGPVETNFGYHVIRLDDIRAGEEQTLDEVRDDLLEEFRTDRADEMFYELANELADRAFDAYDELATVATGLDVPLKTLERFPRSGDPSAFPNSAPIVEAVFNSIEAEQGINSPLLELSDEHVAVVRVTERFPPEQRPLEEVEDEIRDLLRRQRAAAMAAEAAEAFRAELPEELTAEFIGGGNAAAQTADSADGAAATVEAADLGEAAGTAASGEATDAGDSDPLAAAEADGATAPGAAADGDGAESPAARLAAMHGGRWIGPTWVSRSDGAVPTAILAQAFMVQAPEGRDTAAQPVALASGDRAMLFVLDMQPGVVDALSREERDRLQQQLIDQIGTAELGSYSRAVREQADVRVPPEILEPQF